MCRTVICEFAVNCYIFSAFNFSQPLLVAVQSGRYRVSRDCFRTAKVSHGRERTTEAMQGHAAGFAKNLPFFSPHPFGSILPRELGRIRCNKKAYCFVKNLAFLHPLPLESSGKQLNSITTLYASNNLKIQRICNS